MEDAVAAFSMVYASLRFRRSRAATPIFHCYADAAMLPPRYRCQIRRCLMYDYDDAVTISRQLITPRRRHAYFAAMLMPH